MTRPYRGIAPADRVAERRAALVATGMDCLHDDGLSGVSVRSVCARARLSPRYFYESFADLDELLVAVVDSVTDEVISRAVSGLAASSAPLAAQVRMAIDGGYGVLVSDPRKATAFLVAAGGHGPLAARRSEVVLRYAELAMAQLPQLGGQPDQRAARATALFLMGGAAEVMAAALSGRLPLSRARVVDRLTALWVAVLAP